MDKAELQTFLLQARKQTYAAGDNKSKPLLDGSVQYQFSQDDWLYRDIYYTGNKRFAGLETVYFQNKPVWSMSYFGNFQQVSEEEADIVLRAALRDNWDKARLGQKVAWSKDSYEYGCVGSGDMDELDGTESITKNGKQIYYFYYAGGFVG